MSSHQLAKREVTPRAIDINVSNTRFQSLFEVHEVLIKMIIEGRRPALRHVSRSHLVDFDWSVWEGPNKFQHFYSLCPKRKTHFGHFTKGSVTHFSVERLDAIGVHVRTTERHDSSPQTFSASRTPTQRFSPGIFQCCGKAKPVVKTDINSVSSPTRRPKAMAFLAVGLSRCRERSRCGNCLLAKLQGETSSSLGRKRREAALHKDFCRRWWRETLRR